MPSDAAAHAFAALEPDVVLDALAAIGLLGDGRLMALNSYENRVFLAHLEQPLQTDADVPVQAVVAKFYRPGRWSHDQIAEEHAFSQGCFPCINMGQYANHNFSHILFKIIFSFKLSIPCII